MTISHFGAVLLFSLFTSVIFGITQRSEPRMMIRFGAFCFALFVGGTIAASWVMWLIKHESAQTCADGDGISSPQGLNLISARGVARYFPTYLEANK